MKFLAKQWHDKKDGDSQGIAEQPDRTPMRQLNLSNLALT